MRHPKIFFSLFFFFLAGGECLAIGKIVQFSNVYKFITVNLNNLMLIVGKIVQFTMKQD